ncbi:MAG TPA: bifunctional phosphoribosylaminoimidazolecarboxamide formyltransferase/IMP cyclohydrolase [Anaerolineae bacterium]
MPRAILSVYDKSGLIDLAQGLHDMGWELIASGGTAQALHHAGLPAVEVADITGFPELLGGRVKTLHPAVHGPILATGSSAHMAELAAHGLTPIDLVVCNLYPFSQTVARPGVSIDEAVEQIDIGGVTLLRAAAKNHARVTVLCRPADYAPFLAELGDGPISLATRKRLAYAAFELTSAYDTAIRDYLAGQGYAGTTAETVQEAGAFPPELHLDLRMEQALRYGENPHQAATLYNLPGIAGPMGGRLLHGKPLSYNNLLDLDAAWHAVRDFELPTIAIIKHTNPCGLASASTLAEAYPAALAGDPQAAYGGILAANRPIDETTANLIGSLFLECIVAPGFEPAARARLTQKANLRMLEMPQTDAGEVGPAQDVLAWEFRSIGGGLLAQQADRAADDEASWRVVTKRQPSDAEWQALRFAWAAAHYLKSNAIALAQGQALVGAGAGQMSRVDAVHMAIYKAGDRARGAALGSDAFFPFPDSLELAGQAGVSAVIQPGGSVRDDEVIAAADRLSLAMVFTGTRHFRH